MIPIRNWKHIDDFAEDIEKNKGEDKRFIAYLKPNVQFIELHIIATGNTGN